MTRLPAFLLAAFAAGALPALAQDVGEAPPPAPYQEVSKLVKLPDFLPGLGQLFVDPATLPAGPFLAYDHDGKLVSTIYMIPVADLNPDKSFDNLAAPGGDGRPRRHLLQRRPSGRRGAARASRALARAGGGRGAGGEMILTRRRLLGLGGGSPPWSLLPAAGAPPPVTHAIRMQGDATGAHVGFDPVGLRIRPGETVRWINADAGNAHTATAYHPANFDRPRRIPAAADAVGFGLSAGRRGLRGHADGGGRL